MRPEEGKDGASRAQARLPCLWPLPAASEAHAPAKGGAMRIDFGVSGGGSVYLFKPLTPAARDWVDEHLPEDASWWCGAVVVEHRYIGPIVGGAIGDGLVVR